MLEGLQARGVVFDDPPVVEGGKPIDEGGIPELRPMTACETGRLGVAMSAQPIRLVPALVAVVVPYDLKSASGVHARVARSHVLGNVGHHHSADTRIQSPQVLRHS